MVGAQKLFLFSLLLILQFTLCTSIDSINTSQIIKDGDLLISKGNNFVLGFFSPGSSSYRYLGVWYHKVPEVTVVWVANRNHPIKDTSGVLSFSQYGNLVLYSNHDQKVPVWSTNISVEMEATDTCLAQLLDSGNLVLVRDGSRKIVWESFDHPTNVFLPGMKLGLDRKRGIDRFLTSWRSADDPGVGDFSVRLNPDGSPQFFHYEGSKPFSRSAPWPWRSRKSLYNKSFVNNENEIYCTYTVPDDSLILRIIVDLTGFVKLLTWHESDGQWKEFWKAPQFWCDSYGQCGAYGICESGDYNTFQCACLPGYEPRYSKQWLLRDGSGGCVRKRSESSSLDGSGEGFVKVQNVLLPDTSAAVWVGISMSRSDCELECKKNSSCSAYASIDISGKGDGCLTWYGVLIDTKYEKSPSYDLYVRVDAYELADNARRSNGLPEKEILSILVPSIASFWFLIISLFAYLWFKKRETKGTLISKELWRNSNATSLEFFMLSTINTATNSFSPANKLGQGGFGTVYKGQLPNGQVIAVKRLSKNSGQGIEEFKNEVIVIANLQHRNLVKLLGCCIQGGEKILIYEYLSNKSLDSFLFDQTRRLFLDWRTRFDIILGIARGILYLHQDSRLRIIHRDLKCSNILLDAGMNPKISDFGMAKIFESEQIQGKTSRVVGTYGYMSPEYAALGKFSVKSDVFSFGVMLLEIVSGKKNNRFYPQHSSLMLIGHVWELWREDRALEVVDSLLVDSYRPQEVLKCIQIGLLCVQEDPMDRPSMLAVVFMLNSETATIPSPKQPAFIFKESCKNRHVAVDVDGGGDGPCSINDVTITALPGR